MSKKVQESKIGHFTHSNFSRVQLYCYRTNSKFVVSFHFFFNFECGGEAQKLEDVIERVGTRISGWYVNMCLITSGYGESQYCLRSCASSLLLLLQPLPLLSMSFPLPLSLAPIDFHFGCRQRTEREMRSKKKNFKKKRLLLFGNFEPPICIFNGFMFASYTWFCCVYYSKID